MYGRSCGIPRKLRCPENMVSCYILKLVLIKNYQKQTQKDKHCSCILKLVLIKSYQTRTHKDKHFSYIVQLFSSASRKAAELFQYRFVRRLSVCPSVCLSIRPSRLRGGGVYLRNASVTFLLFWHEASFG